jgi:hypothetical protein
MRAMPWDKAGGITWRQYVKLAMGGGLAAARAHPEATSAAAKEQPEYTSRAAERLGMRDGEWQLGMLVWGARMALQPRLARKFARATLRKRLPGIGLLLQVFMSFAPIPKRPPVDTDDPELQAVDGVSLEDYVLSLRQQFDDARTGARHPVDEAAATEWGARVVRNENVQTRYYELVCRHLA